ncbi:MAG: helix-turn-helix domain-containing protein [Pleurocapsa sp. SU_196_0]|nr:helix-turn-helix domain-containing protein [Pleurocapsa sp. SU_196_0]
MIEATDHDLTVYTAEEVAGILKTTVKRAEGLFRAGSITTFRVGASRRCTKRAVLEFIRAGGGSQPMPPAVKAELNARKRDSQHAKTLERELERLFEKAGSMASMLMRLVRRTVTRNPTVSLVAQLRNLPRYARVWWRSIPNRFGTAAFILVPLGWVVQMSAMMLVGFLCLLAAALLEKEPANPDTPGAVAAREAEADRLADEQLAILTAKLHSGSR